MQRIRIKIKLEYKIEKNSKNFEQKKKKIKNRKESTRKLEGWCRTHDIQITGVLAKEAEKREETIQKNK